MHQHPTVTTNEQIIIEMMGQQRYESFGPAGKALMIIAMERARKDERRIFHEAKTISLQQYIDQLTADNLQIKRAILQGIQRVGRWFRNQFVNPAHRCAWCGCNLHKSKEGNIH